jgi:hypothetical protein
MQKIYDFTNENVSAYKDLFDFSNARVLTVLGSGDQYFTSLLNGAKNIEVFDYNIVTWYYFLLKFTAIKYLSYEDFYQMFITDNLDNLKIYNKLLPYLPEDCIWFFNKLYLLRRKFSSIVTNNTLFLASLNNNSIKIPYLNKEKYYELQEILKHIDIPVFYNCNLLDLKNLISSDFDILILSNIYHYLDFSVSDYQEFLDEFNIPNILALYTWAMNSEEQNEFYQNGFDITKIPGITNRSNYIVSLNKR